MYGSVKKQNKSKIQKQSGENNTIKNIGNIFKLKKKNEAIKSI